MLNPLKRFGVWGTVAAVTLIIGLAAVLSEAAITVSRRNAVQVAQSAKGIGQSRASMPAGVIAATPLPTPPDVPTSASADTAPAVPPLSPPLPEPAARITKKPFGLKVSPQNSPVSPERFSGYHTGTDFETFPDEQDKDVAVSAVCSGPLLEKRRASGYGGIAVQRCNLDGRDVTVVYGHLVLARISPAVGVEIAAGTPFAVLGKGYSYDTDGERKHLHLGIHLGAQINIKGYVATRAELDHWFDAAALGGWTDVSRPGQK